MQKAPAAAKQRKCLSGPQTTTTVTVTYKRKSTSPQNQPNSKRARTGHEHPQAQGEVDVAGPCAAAPQANTAGRGISTPRRSSRRPGKTGQAQVNNASQCAAPPQTIDAYRAAASSRRSSRKFERAGQAGAGNVSLSDACVAGSLRRSSSGSEKPAAAAAQAASDACRTAPKRSSRRIARRGEQPAAEQREQQPQGTPGAGKSPGQTTSGMPDPSSAMKNVANLLGGLAEDVGTPAPAHEGDQSVPTTRLQRKRIQEGGDTAAGCRSVSFNLKAKEAVSSGEVARRTPLVPAKTPHAEQTAAQTPCTRLQARRMQSGEVQKMAEADSSPTTEAKARNRGKGDASPGGRVASAAQPHQQTPCRAAGLQAKRSDTCPAQAAAEDSTAGPAKANAREHEAAARDDLPHALPCELACDGHEQKAPEQPAGSRSTRRERRTPGFMRDPEWLCATSQKRLRSVAGEGQCPAEQESSVGIVQAQLCPSEAPVPDLLPVSVPAEAAADDGLAGEDVQQARQAPEEPAGTRSIGRKRRPSSLMRDPNYIYSSALGRQQRPEAVADDLPPERACGTSNPAAASNDPASSPNSEQQMAEGPVAPNRAAADDNYELDVSGLQADENDGCHGAAATVQPKRSQQKASKKDKLVEGIQAAFNARIEAAVNRHGLQACSSDSGAARERSVGSADGDLAWEDSMVASPGADAGDATGQKDWEDLLAVASPAAAEHEPSSACCLEGQEGSGKQEPCTAPPAQVEAPVTNPLDPSLLLRRSSRKGGIPPEHVETDCTASRKRQKQQQQPLPPMTPAAFRDTQLKQAAAELLARRAAQCTVSNASSWTNSHADGPHSEAGPICAGGGYGEIAGPQEHSSAEVQTPGPVSQDSQYVQKAAHQPAAILRQSERKRKASVRLPEAEFLSPRPAKQAQRSRVELEQLGAMCQAAVKRCSKRTKTPNQKYMS